MPRNRTPQPLIFHYKLLLTVFFSEWLHLLQNPQRKTWEELALGITLLSIVCDFWQPLLYRRVKIARENIFAQMFKFKLVFSANVLSKQVEQNFCANKMACLIYKRYSINLFSKHAKINSSSKHPNLVEEKKPHLGSHSHKQRLEGSSLLLTWHYIHDTWYMIMTRDKWHVKSDMWYVIHDEDEDDDNDHGDEDDANMPIYTVEHF